MFVGNDIVAYKHVRCIGKWQNERFLQKILQSVEVEALHQQTNKDAYLWTLWTLKEAAYKLSCFLGNRNKFHPIQFLVKHTLIMEDNFVQHVDLICDQKTGESFYYYTSMVHFGNIFFYGKTLITHQFIHSLVTDAESNPQMVWAIGEHNNYNKDDYSTEVRSFAKEQLHKSSIICNAIEKEKNGIPFIVNNETANYISLSHDQQFVSFAFIP